MQTKPKVRTTVAPQRVRVGGIESYLRKIFTLMFGAVAVTAITSFITIYLGGIRLLVSPAGMTPFCSR